MANLRGIITPSDIVTTSGTEVFTNKTIDADNNTISNIDLTSQVKNVLPIASGGTGSNNGSPTFSGTVTAAVFSGGSFTGDGSALTGLIPIQTGNADKYLYTNGTSVSWQALNIPEYAYIRNNFTATANQTQFNLPYTVGYVDVYLNGIKLITGVDFTAANGTSITLSAGAASGDTIETIAFEGFVVADALMAADIGATVQPYNVNTLTTSLVSTVAISGDYDDLINKPTLAADLSDLTDTTSLLFDGSYTSLTSVPTNLVTTDSVNDLTNKNFIESIHTLTGININPANGGIQIKSITANTTFTENMVDGESVILMLNGASSYIVTWPTTTWVSPFGNVAPTLTSNDQVVLFKANDVLYGTYVGSYS